MNDLPVAVGDAEVQKRFISSHEDFLREFPQLKVFTEKLFTMSIERYNAQFPTDEPEDPEDPEEFTKHLAQIIVFYLGRTTFDAFGDLLILAGNGRGFAARMMLRVMYEHLVTAAFIAQNPSEAKRFGEHASIQKGKILNRSLKILPDIKDTLGHDTIQRVQEQFQLAQTQLKTETCKKCGQPITQEAWTRVNVDTMAEKSDAATGTTFAKLYTPCYLVPTAFIHPTALGLEVRAGLNSEDIIYRELSENEAHDAVMRGHALVLRLLKHQNGFFNLGFDQELAERWNIFPATWGGASPEPATDPI